MAHRRSYGAVTCAIACLDRICKGITIEMSLFRLVWWDYSKEIV